ncbi:MAG: hypothetical protein ACPGED_08920, partial [Flavobacteriales bacterium]
MTPSINGILFVLSALFGLNTVFIAEESKLILDLESKTATIEYFDVKTPIQVIEYAEEGLKSIEQGVVFPSGQAWL